ncbi:MAG TPA: hypothetical protein VHA06_07020 [Candidatus Angelobacter sp.]|jgi:hypothetical protein|nr:hypothetical protein [Candidatus Angelobacter sp.]
MSRWLHSICQQCWDRRNPGRQAVKMREEYRDEKADICCFCGKSHGSGISLREDPAKTICQGNHNGR